MRVFTLISNSRAEEKVEIIEKYRNQMNIIENEIQKQNYFIQN